MTLKRKCRPVLNPVMCAACGECAESCPRLALTIAQGVRAAVDYSRCVGCGACAVACPASAIRMEKL